MKTKTQSKAMILIYLAGFFAGILYMNLVSGRYFTGVGMLDSAMTELFVESDVSQMSYLWYLIKIRLLPILVLLAFGMTRLRRVVSAAFLIWTGLLCGMVFTYAVVSQGVLGLVLCTCALFPQIFCYIVGYGLLLMTICYYPEKHWNYEKIMVFCLAICIGIALEYKSNPIMVKLVLKAVRKLV